MSLQPAALSAITARAAQSRQARALRPRSRDDIHDPLRHDDDLLGGTPLESTGNGLERQNRLTDLSLARIPGHRQLRATLAVDLNRKRDCFVDRERAVNLGPGSRGDEILMAESM